MELLLIVIIPGMTESFQVVEELVSVKTLHGRRTGEDLFLNVCVCGIVKEPALH
jgi:hypothetical protein